MNFERFGQNVENRSPRIERRIRILKNHLDFSTQRERHSRRRETRNFVAPAKNFSAVDRLQTQNCAAERRFPATGFADQTDDFPARNFERNIIDRRKNFLFRKTEKLPRSRSTHEPHGQIFHPQNRILTRHLIFVFVCGSRKRRAAPPLPSRILPSECKTRCFPARERPAFRQDYPSKVRTAS